VRCRLRDGARVIVRPSGTEPKLKCYFEAVVPVVSGDVTAARAVATDRLTAIKRDLAELLLQPA
jgi:phosphomannomutase